MNRPDSPPPNQDSALFTNFVQQQRNPQLMQSRDHIYGEFLLLPNVRLNEAEDAACKAIEQVMPGHFGRAIERQVLASFQYLTHLRNLIPTETEWLRQIISDWHSYLDEAVTPDYPLPHLSGKQVLAAFSIVEDYTVSLSQDFISQLVKAVTTPSQNLPPTHALYEAHWRAARFENKVGGKLDEGIWDGTDILALLIVLMNREGLKPAVLDPQLQAWVIEYFGRYASKTLGGAAGNEAYILHQMSQALGLSVLVHTPYHHAEQAKAAPEGANRLIFEETGLIQPFPSLHEKGHLKDARRLSFVLQLTPTLDEQNNIIGPELTVGNQTIRPKLTDRVILRIPQPRTDAPQPWQTLRVIWKTKERTSLRPPINGDPSRLTWDDPNQQWVLELDRRAEVDGVPVFKNFLANDWPYLPIFQHRPQIEGKTLVIELAATDKLKTITPTVQVVLLGGIQMLAQTVFSETLSRLLHTALIAQLQVFRSQGASLHLELSGVASGQMLAKLSQLCHEAGIWHISTNREELVQMTTEFGSAYFVSPRPIVPESPFTIYWRAEQLLSRLKLQTYYIHDQELDILVRRNQPGESPETTEQALKQHRQAMLLAKAAVPAVLIERARAEQEWSLALSTQSLTTLLSFADEYTAYLTATTGAEKQASFEHILHTGYYRHPDRQHGISVVVTPTIFIDFSQQVSLSGAGDMGFATQAIMSSLS